jgi:hypothetical protein
MKSVHEVQAEGNLRKLVDLRAEVEAFAVREAAGRRNARRKRGGSCGPSWPAPRGGEEPRPRCVPRGRLSSSREHRVLAAVPTLRAIWARLEALAAFHRESLKVYWPDLRVLIDRARIPGRRPLRARCGGSTGRRPQPPEGGVVPNRGAAWRHPARGGSAAAATAYYFLPPAPSDPPVRVAREIAFASPGHLSKLFRERHGKSFRAYL